MFYEEDLAAFFTDFGEAAMLANGEEVIVLFDNEYASAVAVGIDVESSRPVAVLKSADAEDFHHGDTIEIRGLTYSIVGIHPDGTGITTLLLSL